MQTVCPISKTKIDENVARLNAISTIVFALLTLIHWGFAVFLTIDFLMRILKIKFSVIARINKFIVNILDVEPIPIDAAPKKFAGTMGFVMALLLFVFSLLKISIAFYIVLIILISAASLEAFFNFCMGCKIYSMLFYIRCLMRKD